MDSFILKVGEKEYRIAMSTAKVCMAEKALNGTSLLDAMDNVVSVSVQQTLLWAALQEYNHGMTQEKTCALMDEMRNGCVIDGEEYENFSIETRLKLCTKILTVAGFFTDADSAELNEMIGEATSK